MNKKSDFYFTFFFLFCSSVSSLSAETIWLKNGSGTTGRFGNYGESITFAEPDKLIVTSLSIDTTTSIGNSMSIARYMSVYDTSGNLLWQDKSDLITHTMYDSSGDLITFGDSIIIRSDLDAKHRDTLPDNTKIAAECMGVTKSSYVLGGIPISTGVSDSSIKRVIRSFDYSFNQKSEIQFKCKRKGYCKLDHISASETMLACSGLFGSAGDTLWIDNNVLIARDVHDRFFLLFNENGFLVLGLQFTNTANNLTIGSVQVSQDGNVYVGGGYEGVLNVVNNYSKSSGGEDAFVMKILSSGKIAWIKTWGSDSYDDHCSAISISGSEIWVTGIAAESFSGEQKSNTGKVFMVSFDTYGTVKQDALLEGTGRGEGCGISVSSDRVFLTGYFSGEIFNGFNYINTNKNEYNLLLGAFSKDGNVSGQMYALKTRQHFESKQVIRAESFVYDLRGRLIKDVKGLDRSNSTVCNLRYSKSNLPAQIVIRRNGKL